MNYRITQDGETIARFKLMEDAKFFIDMLIEHGGINTTVTRLMIVARNGETFIPAEWAVKA